MVAVVALSLVSLSVSAQGERLQVVASHTILADVVANIVGDAADVTSLMAAGADPHTYTPIPADLARLSNADVVFTNGANFEEGLLKTIENAAADINIVEVSQNVEILPFAATEHETGEPITPLGLGSDVNCHAGHGAAPDSGSAGGEEDHESGCDPHVWWDVNNVMSWTDVIRDTMSMLDPANADIYTANASAYDRTLESLLNDEIIPQVETIPQDRRIFVTDHDTLGYFANAFGFRIVGVVIPGGSTTAEASASEIASLIDSIRASHVSAIFIGTTVSPILSDQIADEAGAVGVTLYTDSLSDADGPAPTYIDFMRYNVQTIVSALTS